MWSMRCRVNFDIMIQLIFWCYCYKSSGPDKLICSRPIGYAKLKKTFSQTQSAHSIEEQLETLIFVFYYPSRTWSFQFWLHLIENVRSKSAVVSSSYLIVVWMSKIRYLSKDNFLTSDAEDYDKSRKLC